MKTVSICCICDAAAWLYHISEFSKSEIDFHTNILEEW